MSRPVLSVALQVVIGTLLTLVLAGTYFTLVVGVPPAEAYFDQAIRLVLTFVDIGIVTWFVLLIVGAVRKRGIGWGVGGSIIAAFAGAVMNLIWILILSIAGGGADLFAIALGVQADIFFLIAVVIVALLVHRALLKPPAGSGAPT
jgi:hypothetical protein